eukprot:481499-Amphidinium_carterae.2
MPAGVVKQAFAPLGFEVLTLGRERRVKNTVVKCDLSPLHGVDVLRALAADQRSVGLICVVAFPSTTSFPAKAWKARAEAALSTSSCGFVLSCAGSSSVRGYASLRQLLEQGFKHKVICACAFHIQEHDKMERLLRGLLALDSLLRPCQMSGSVTATCEHGGD